MRFPKKGPRLWKERAIVYLNPSDDTKEISVSEDGMIVTSLLTQSGPLYTEEMPVMNKNGSGLIKICEKYWAKILTENNFEENYDEMMAKLKDRNIGLIDQERLEYYQKHK